MFTSNRIIFAHHHFFSQIARILLGYIEKAGVFRADKLDLYSGWLRHGAFLKTYAEKKSDAPGAACVGRANAEKAAICQEKADFG